MPRTALYSVRAADYDDDELGFDETRHVSPPQPPFRFKILLLITLSSTLLPLCIVCPAVLPDDHTYFDYPRYGLNDMLRTLDPFLNFPLVYLLFMSARPTPSMFLSSLFALSATMYITGSVAHTMSAMFKHSVEVILDSFAGPPPTPIPPSVQDTYFYIRNIWEHIIGHYLYAAGMTCTSALTIVVHFHASYPPLPFFSGWMLLYSAILSGTLYALVATQLPYAPIIGIVLFAFVFTLLGYLLWKDGELGLHRWASRPIPQLYFMSTGIACILTIAWTVVKGIKGRNLD